MSTAAPTRRLARHRTLRAGAVALALLGAACSDDAPDTPAVPGPAPAGVPDPVLPAPVGTPSTTAGDDGDVTSQQVFLTGPASDVEVGEPAAQPLLRVTPTGDGQDIKVVFEAKPPGCTAVTDAAVAAGPNDITVTVMVAPVTSIQLRPVDPSACDIATVTQHLIVTAPEPILDRRFIDGATGTVHDNGPQGPLLPEPEGDPVR